MYFAQMLQLNTTLQQLDLGDCDLVCFLLITSMSLSLANLLCPY